MSPPVGLSKTVMIGGVERDLQLEPRVLSRKCVEAMMRLYKKQVARDVMESLRELKDDDTIDDEMHGIMHAEYKGMLQASSRAGLQEAAAMLTTPEGLVQAYAICSNLTLEDSKRMVSEAESLVPLIEMIQEVKSDEELSGKKLDPPKRERKSKSGTTLLTEAEADAELMKQIPPSEVMLMTRYWKRLALGYRERKIVDRGERLPRHKKILVPNQPTSTGWVNLGRG